MRRFRLALPISITLLTALFLWLVALGSGALGRDAHRAQAQIPTPGPPGSNICGAGQYTGGQTVVVRNLEITFPSGGDYTAHSGLADPGGEFVRACYVQGNSAIFFNLEGRETSRVVKDPAANSTLDQIAASVRVVAQTPGTPMPAVGLRHTLQVFDRGAAGPAPDGTTVVLSRRIGREERAQIERTGIGPGACATLTVRAGQAELTPQFTVDCPEGSEISGALDFHDGTGVIGVLFEPPVEWRMAGAGEPNRTVTVKPDQPRTGGAMFSVSSGVRPPDTGDGGLAGNRTPSGGSNATPSP
jgi:hypothetical protein